MTQARGALRRATLLVAVAALTAAGIATSTTGSQAAKPDNKGNIAKARFFSFNDFHGALDPPTGSGGLVNGTPGGRRGVPRHDCSRACAPTPRRTARRP